MNNNPINHSWKHGIWPIEIRKSFKKLNYEHTHTHTHTHTHIYILWLFLTQFVINIWLWNHPFFFVFFSCYTILLWTPIVNKPQNLDWKHGNQPKIRGKKRKKEKASISFNIYVFYLHNYFLQMCDQHLGIQWIFHEKEEERMKKCT
jgi:hypothetical protein